MVDSLSHPSAPKFIKSVQQFIRESVTNKQTFALILVRNYRNSKVTAFVCKKIQSGRVYRNNNKIFCQHYLPERLRNNY